MKARVLQPRTGVQGRAVLPSVLVCSGVQWCAVVWWCAVVGWCGGVQWCAGVQWCGGGCSVRLMCWPAEQSYGVCRVVWTRAGRLQPAPLRFPRNLGVGGERREASSGPGRPAL